MAISIVMADDEFRVIEMLRNLVDWDALGYEIVGEASDGDSALTQIMQLRPHLLITDIRMPGLSGLQLIRQAKEAQPDLQVICISGYSDFEYAKKAMSLGVTDYLLKPIDEDQLVPLLAKIRSQVIQSEQLKRQLSQLSRYEQNRQWVKIMRGDRHPGLGVLDILWTHRYGTVILLELDDETLLELEDHEIELNRFIVENILDDYSRMRTNGTLHWFEKSSIAYGIVWNHSQPSLTECPVWVEELKVLLERCCKFRISLGIGTAVDSIAQLNASYKAAYFALEQRFFFGKGTVLLADGSGALADGEEALQRIDIKPLSEAIAAKDEERLTGLIRALFRQYRSKRLSERVVKHLLVDATVGMIQPIHASNGSVHQMIASGGGLDSLMTKRTLDDLQQWFERFCMQLITYDTEVQKKRPHKIVSQLEHYLAEHYAEPLTLKGLGELFYVHPNYLGQLVKKEKNMSLSQWLNHIRIGQAMKRLAESDDLITAIAEQVGYSDLNYFYSQFRKIEGRSPREYRGNRK
jgi:two-component system response regulator YesN